jgi:hypothetical protein
VTLPGGNPVIEVPGSTPRFPSMVVGPVLVTVEPPRTAKLPKSDPRIGNANPWEGVYAIVITTKNPKANDFTVFMFILLGFFQPLREEEEHFSEFLPRIEYA